MCTVQGTHELLATNLWLEFVCAHVDIEHEVVNDCKSAVPFKFLQLK